MYSIFQRDKRAANGTFDFSKPPSIAGISKNFEQTDIIQRGSEYCFVVRYNTHVDLPAGDENTAEKCTAFEAPMLFDGIESVTQRGRSEVVVTWVPGNSPDIVKYRVYGGSEFDEVLVTVNAEDTEAVVGDRNPDVVYVFGVKAVDAQGREDNNVQTIPIKIQAF